MDFNTVITQVLSVNHQFRSSVVSRAYRRERSPQARRQGGFGRHEQAKQRGSSSRRHARRGKWAHDKPAIEQRSTGFVKSFSRSPSGGDARAGCPNESGDNPALASLLDQPSSPAHTEPNPCPAATVIIIVHVDAATAELSRSPGDVETEPGRSRTAASPAHD
jgi:hypothetical protein